MKFNSDKCATCRYHGTRGMGNTVHKEDGTTIRVYCNYSGHSNTTCLKPGPHNTVVDTRGNEYNNCKLYLEGDPFDES